jgi:hypothetical protein
MKVTTRHLAGLVANHHSRECCWHGTEVDDRPFACDRDCHVAAFDVAITEALRARGEDLAQAISRRNRLGLSGRRTTELVKELGQIDHALTKVGYP